MKQEHVIPGATSLAFLCLAAAVMTTLSGCASSPGMSAPTSSTSATPPGPKPAPLVASSVGSVREVPASVRTPIGQSMFLLVSGSGVQIYECAAKAGSPGAFAWTFRSPEASLIGMSGDTIGKHYAGPTWESTDGSTVVGAIAASDPGPDASAIPWLLLNVKSTTGSGVFTQTKSIQRLQTIGGVAPTTACASTNAGAMSRVPYAATYAFFRVSP